MGRGTAQKPEFPSYTAVEAAADRVVHLVGVPAAIASACWLVATACATATGKQVFASLVYGVGLVGMLAASAAYNLARPGRAKALLRRLDHAMIFVMIAGSYTPFALNALGPPFGIALCGAEWGLAATGIGITLAFPGIRRWERLSLALYLGMGWLLLPAIRPLAASLPGGVLLLLLAGGVVYTLGALVHARGGGRVPYHNAVWHAMVLVAAGLHFAAVAQVLTGGAA